MNERCLLWKVLFFKLPDTQNTEERTLQSPVLPIITIKYEIKLCSDYLDITTLITEEVGGKTGL